MRVKVLLFASLRQAAGQSELELDLPDASSVRTAADVLRGRLEDLRLDGVMCAVNERYADPSTALREGDTVAFLPPVSGG